MDLFLKHPWRLATVIRCSYALQFRCRQLFFYLLYNIMLKISIDTKIIFLKIFLYADLKL